MSWRSSQPKFSPPILTRDKVGVKMMRIISGANDNFIEALVRLIILLEFKVENSRYKQLNIIFEINRIGQRVNFRFNKRLKIYRKVQNHFYVLNQCYSLYIRNRIMEEKNEKSIDTKFDSKEEDKVVEELKKISQIEKSIADMQAHVKFLLKRQSEQQKKLSKIKDQSIKKAASKISFVSELAQSQEVKKKKNELFALKNSQVKQFREKQLNLMKQTRLEISKLKEVQRTEVREISKRNEERVKKMKQEQKTLNYNKALNIKNQHASLIRQKQISRQLSKKKKQEEALRKSIIRLNEKEKLEIERQRLRMQQEQITARLEKKKQIKMKFHETSRKISSMKPSEVLQKSKRINELNSKEEDIEDLEKLLFKTAIQKMGNKQRQSILFLR